ncbi:MAG: N-6 DNA methylase, partial [Halobacteria archaeon]|nr:N-6 DNA methylase [Halobacteria archaeon]
MAQTTIERRPYDNSELFSSYYLDERIQGRDEWDCDEDAEEVMEEIQNLYEDESPVVEGYKEDALIDNWIDGVLEILGFGTQKEATLPNGRGHVDSLLFENQDKRRKAAEVNLDTDDTTDLFERGITILEAKQWNADFTERFNEQRPYRNASHQTKHYLEKTPSSIQWGILTNGRKWRLYGTKDYETQIYYEVDLPELLENGDLEEFKYFYLFFRPVAFVDEGEFLDSVWSESETAAQQLGEDLQDNVFTALRVLGRGFVETNDLDIDPDDEEALDELKNQSLVLLYRLMFVLYAESRGLIHPKKEGRDAVREYEENFSLDELRLDIHEEIGEVDEGFEDVYSDYSTKMWSRLEDLFRLIDQGEEDLGIPAYNGGLFDHDSHGFLTRNSVSDRYIAEVIYRLSTTQNEEGRYVLADYGDLDTRHLGSVYEGLLEHQFEIAPEQYAAVSEDGGQVWKPATEVSVADAVETVPKGGLYVVNDEGERKATGAYYTPDYVVQYIVEETVSPLVDEIRDDLVDQGFERGTQEYLGAFLQRVKNLQILDPAMGSAHFLTSATGYLAEEVMSEVRDVEAEVGTFWDEQHVRREIAKDCIYGVDINGMAVELGKLSMWLETLAADRPLAFLDHHLKTGNSLVGSDITEVLSAGDDDDSESQVQATLQNFDQVRTKTLDHVMDLMQELLEVDNESLSDIKSMEELYDEIRSDPLYQRLFELANVHTAEEFGVDVPEGAYEQMATSIQSESEWSELQGEDWFIEAQEKARVESFFHWELEYPAVFFDEDGEKKDEAGFDAVIGNPPYGSISASDVGKFAGYGSSDLYAQFILSMPHLISTGGQFSFITPTSWETGPAYEDVRSLLLNDGSLNNLVNLPYDVFDDAYVDTAIFVWRAEEPSGNCTVVDKSGERISPANALQDIDYIEISVEKWQELGFVAVNETWLRVFSSFGEEYTSLGDISNSTRGVLVTDEAIDSDDADTPILLDSFQRYEKLTPDETAEVGKLKEMPSDESVFDGERILIRRLVSRSDRLLGSMTDEFFISKKDTYIFKTEKLPPSSLLSLLNSSFLSWWHFNTELAASKDDFRQVTLSALRDLPIPESVLGLENASVTFTDEYLSGSLSKREFRDENEDEELLYNLPDAIISLNQDRGGLNTNLLDHLGVSTEDDLEGETLA